MRMSLRILITAEKLEERVHLRSCFKDLPFNGWSGANPPMISEEPPSQGSVMFVLSRHPKGSFYDLVITQNNISRLGNLELLKIIEENDLSPSMPFIVCCDAAQISSLGKRALPENAFLLENPVTTASMKKAMESICATLVRRENNRRKKEIEELMARLAAGKKILNFPSQLEGIYITSASKLMHYKKYAPWHYLPYLSLAQIYAGCNKYEDVIPYAKTAVKISPDCLDAHKLLALSFKKTSRSFEELEELLETLKGNPGSSIILLKVGEAFLRKGEYREAERYFVEAINRYRPDEEIRAYARMHVGLGEAYMAAEAAGKNGASLEKARDQFNRAIAIYPLLMSAYNNLILVYKKMGRYDEATKIMALAVDITPNTPEDWVSLFEIFLADGDEEKARFCLNKAMRFDPDNQVILCTAAEAYVRQGMYGEAVSLFEKAVEVNPSDSRLYNFLGICSRQLDRCELAIGYYSKALRLEPDDAALHFNLGVAYRKAGDNKSAKGEWETALRLDPGFAEAREALEKLSAPRNAKVD